jgi:hypothetical protein
MGNPSSYPVKGVRNKIEAAGAGMLYLLLYSGI